LGEPKREIATIRIALMLLLLAISVLALVGCLGQEDEEEEKGGGETTSAEQATGNVAWVDDEPPEGALLGGNEEWKWVEVVPTPFSGTRAHQSNVSEGYHQHEFTGASAPLSVNRGDRLFAYVYLDPANEPEEVMLQWNDGTGWDHRAYWGADKIVDVGEEGTESRRYMGPLPPAGEWVRLEVEASEVGLEDREVNGMAFTLYGGRATWDVAGKAGYAAAPTESEPEGAISQDAVPAPLVPDSTGEQPEMAPTESVPAESATEQP